MAKRFPDGSRDLPQQGPKAPATAQEVDELQMQAAALSHKVETLDKRLEAYVARQLDNPLTAHLREGLPGT